MAIEKLNTGTATGASQVPFYDPTNGQDRRASLLELAAVIQELLGAADDYISAYETPGTGDTVSILPFQAGGSVLMLLTPLATLATLTVQLPLKDQCQHGQELLLHSTQIVTALTVDANGAGISGAPTTLAAGGFFRLRFDAVNEAWYRIG